MPPDLVAIAAGLAAVRGKLDELEIGIIGAQQAYGALVDVICRELGINEERLAQLMRALR